jgi:hypothetical protein
MGTRSITVFYTEDDSPIVAFYRQYDGYPTGHGDELAGFLRTRKLVNGISGSRNEVANGMDCLAALAIAYFKGGKAGNIYVCSPENCEGFNYHVYPQDDTFRLKVEGHSEVIFEGPVSDFNGTRVEEGME